MTRRERRTAFQHNLRASLTVSAPRVAIAATRPNAPMHPAPAAAPSYSGVNLHIGELVLHGFAATERLRIGGAVQAELTHLLAQPLVPEKRGRRSSEATLNLQPGMKAEGIGAEIARSVYRQGLADRLQGGLTRKNRKR